MALEDTRDGCNLSAKFMVSALYTALGTLAVAAGIWAGSGVSASHPFRDTSQAWRVGNEMRPRVASVKNVSYGRQPTEYAPLGFRQIDENFFALVVEQTGIIRPGSAISGGGFAEVFDRKGRLVLRYEAVEDANSSWELNEFMRLPDN
jgi:hypothetical protein